MGQAVAIPQSAYRSSWAGSPPEPGATYPVQVVIYGPSGPIAVEVQATVNPDGSLDLVLPIDGPLPAGTPIQVIIYSPGGPIVIEGSLGPPDAAGVQELVVPEPSPSGA